MPSSRCRTRRCAATGLLPAGALQLRKGRRRPRDASLSVNCRDIAGVPLTLARATRLPLLGIRAPRWRLPSAVTPGTGQRSRPIIDELRRRRIDSSLSTAVPVVPIECVDRLPLDPTHGGCTAVPDFHQFDQRQYPTVSVQHGYGLWHQSYDDDVEDMMDFAALGQLKSVDWRSRRFAADLGCGTGRTAVWLHRKCTPTIDGVDISPEMLAKAETQGLHRELREADVRASTLPSGAYDLVICSLVEEHLPDLRPLYREAHRLMAASGVFVLVGLHPFFIMRAGMPTHFEGGSGPVAIETHIHLPSEHVAAGREAGLVAEELVETTIDEEWVRRKPRWRDFREWPISFAWSWSLSA